MKSLNGMITRAISRLWHILILQISHCKFKGGWTEDKNENQAITGLEEAIITTPKVKWAIMSFEPFKYTEHGGIIPALQEAVNRFVDIFKTYTYTPRTCIRRLEDAIS